MRRQVAIVGGAALFGLAVWVIDAVVHATVFGQGTISDLLIWHVPSYELWNRLTALGCTVAFGLLIALTDVGRQRAESSLGRANRILRVLRNGSEALARAGQESEFLNEICRIIVDVGGYRLAWIGLLEHDAERTIRPVAHAGFDAGYLDALRVTWADDEWGRGPSGTAARTGESSVARHIATDPRFGPWREEALKRGFLSSASMPLKADGRVLGTLNVSAAQPDAFDAQEMKLLEELAGDVAYGMAAVRTRAEHERAQAEVRNLSRFPGENPFPVLRVTPEGVILYANKAAVPLLKGWGRAVGETVPDAWRGWVAAALDSGQNHEVEVAYGDRVFSCVLAPIVDAGYLNIYGRDVTEFKRAEAAREKLEAQLRTAQKMEAVGTLAAGVAHDFNNVLVAILGNVELLEDGLRSAPGANQCLLEELRQIEQAGQRAATLTRQLLAFSRRQVVKPALLDLNRFITESEKMLRHLVGENITLSFTLGAQLASVRADAGQIEQLVLNLVINARDAMPDGGRLTLETADVVLDDGYIATRPEARLGPHVMLTVSDTGCGMDAETQQRIFEPFFTTKELGQGTGLGLATVYGIVRQSGGHIAVYSEPGHGTTFRVYLPAAATAEHAAALAAEEPLPAGAETVLLCEDNDIVRDLAAHILRAAGYTVLVADHAERALALAAEHPGAIHLLLTDVIMPDIDGKQLADSLAATRPTTKTLFVSGYTSDVIAHHGVLDDGVEFLEKPFTRRGLLERVRRVLDQVPSASE